MKVFVKSAAQISAQHPLSEEWFTSPERIGEGLVLSEDPDFSGWIPPMAARRMSRIIKRAVVTSKVALEKASVPSPDAIVTGTGLGCMDNTDRFFNAILENREECLPPTFFMNSTQNTLSSQIALSLGCHGYNNTYSHGCISFQSALWDGFSLIREEAAGNVLVCGFDEMTPEKFAIFGKSPFLKGSPAGECAVSMVLSSDGDKALCELGGMDILHNPSQGRLKETVSAFCDVSGGIGAVVCPVADILPECLPVKGAGILEYEHLFGRSFTSAAFGVYMGALHCRRGRENVLVFDSSDGINVSIIFLKC